MLNEAPLLLSDETDDIVDGEILEKHGPVFKELKTPFVMPQGTGSHVALRGRTLIKQAKTLCVFVSPSDGIEDAPERFTCQGVAAVVENGSRSVVHLKWV